MSKILVIFGASGNQGRSVIDTVLANKELSKKFQIRAVTRDVNKASVVELAKSGVEVVSADMDSTSSMSNVVDGAHTVFLMTNFWESMSATKEVAQGKAVADACKAAGVKHLIFSSLINTTEASQGRLSHISHFDGKAQIEAYIRDIQVPATFVLPGMFMSGFLTMLRKNEEGGYTLALPVSEDKAQIPLLDAASDTGKFVIAVLQAYPSCLGKHVHAAVDYYTPKRILAEFAEVMKKPAAFAQVPGEVFKTFLPPPVAQELLENMLLLEDPGYYAGAALTQGPWSSCDNLTTWKDFVVANREKWL
ncbi:hypothetical protein LTR78_001296 [Recurvomyces mirabilis]|uniref:NmrA-like domain-containing protein n=1 Tax=Recurvomyces mirabilis TaxID=574656 RepID=A0AAE0WVR8_9PEZI|nr:hypothetical protein LTR78_001296 [Recurvomyces mirabilis]KAK5161273.1 hypothetical protein LTS14_001069 [Recurvomyces mirabilis]